ncbi:MAG TPA: SUMF1/EgtB/PvdO family nonheme iron enzyme [bacterium]|nr:SUMF1/EgtB/PvdO family nonheme iron enzyme [bacterium]
MRKSSGIRLGLAFSLFVVALIGVAAGQSHRAFLAGETAAIQGGEFMMGDMTGEGSEPERPVHKVEVSGFRMSVREVTRAQFARFLNLIDAPAPATTAVVVKGVRYAELGESGLKYVDKSYLEADDGTFPVVVTWYGAEAYCNYLGGRLPTEAEWEYAARAGSKSAYPWGDVFDETLANGRDTTTEFKEQTSVKRDPVSNKRTFVMKAEPIDSVPRGLLKPVRSYPPNRWGLYDMIGNAEEWCHDWDSGDYYSSCKEHSEAGKVIDPQGPELTNKRTYLVEAKTGEKWRTGRFTMSGAFKVLRGGAYSSDRKWLRCSARGYAMPQRCRAGFRCVFAAKKQDEGKKE